MTVVSDVAMGQGKTTGERRVDGGVAGASRALYVRVKAVCLGVFVALGMLSMMSLPIGEAHAQIRADKSAPGHQQATVLQTANGLAQVNIQTPTAAGVSVNQFSQFDVQRQGAILNNSRQQTRTQLAGWVQGNPHLARGEATIIVNQVNSRQPSHVQGFVEVAGRRAEVVVANPAGIAVNGGGFINAQGVTLATGQAQLNAQGQLTGMAVNQGVIQIGAQGLNTKDANYTQLIAKAAQVQGGVWANDLSVATGEQHVKFDGKDLNQSAKLKQQAAKDSNTHTTPALAIDVAHLGGMYANSIVLVSNDKGVGVNNAGQLYAGKGSLQLSADGKLSNTGEMIASPAASNTAATSPTAQRSGIQLIAASIDNRGTVASQNVAVKTAQLKNQGGLITASHELKSRSVQLENTHQGQIVAGRVDVQAQAITNRDAAITQTGQQDLVLKTATLTNSGQVGASLSVKEDTAVPPPTQGGPSPQARPHTGVTQTPSSGTAAGTVQIQATPAPVLADGQLIATQSLVNEGGVITANGELHAHVSEDVNNRGAIQVKTFTASGERLQNAGRLVAQDLRLQHAHINNTKGAIYSPNAITLTTQTLTNRAGQIATQGALTLNNVGLLDNTQGELAAAQAVTIGTDSLRNDHGQVNAGGQMDVRVKTSLQDQAGQWTTPGTLRLTAGGLLGENTEIRTGGALTVSTTGQLQLNHAKVQSAQAIALTGAQLTLQGAEVVGQALDLHTAGALNSEAAHVHTTNVRLEAGDWQNARGRILATHTAAIRARSLDNHAGQVQSGGDLTVQLDKALTNQAGTLLAGKALQLAAHTVQSKQGTIAAQGPVHLAIEELFHQDGGVMRSNRELTLSSRRFDNTGGRLESTNNLELNVRDTINNTQGQIQSG